MTAFEDLDDYIALPRASGSAVSADGSRVVSTMTAFLAEHVLGQSAEFPETLG